MSKQLLLILILAAAWALSGPAAPGPIDPDGAPPATETGGPPSLDADTTLAPDSETGPAPVDKAGLRGRIRQLQATLQNVLRRIDPDGTPPDTEIGTASDDPAADTETSPAPAPAAEAATEAAQAAAPVDNTQLLGQIERFQAVIENALRQNVGSTVLSTPKGAYLEGYGAVFSTEASLYRIRPLTPFSPKTYSRQELDQAYQAALERVERLKQDLRQAVAEHGSLLGQLKPDHTLAVIVHLYNGVGDPGRPYPSQLIFKARAGLVGDYRGGKITMEELVRQVRISQF